MLSTSPDVEVSARLTEVLNKAIAGDPLLEDLVRRIAERGHRRELTPLVVLKVRGSGIVAEVHV